MTVPLLRCDGVGKRFTQSAGYILRDVCLEVLAGEAVHVRGANGTGKTTLLRLIAGATRPTSGTVESSARAVGWSPVEPIGGSSLPASALLRAALRAQGAPSGALDDVLSRLELDGHTDQRLGTRSAGTRRKVNVAFALAAQDPAVLVLDEPWAALDAPSAEMLTSLIEERCRAGSCVVFTDHGHAATLPDTVRVVEISNHGLRPVTDGTASLRIDASRRGERRIVVVAARDVAATMDLLLDEGWSIVGVARA